MVSKFFFFHLQKLWGTIDKNKQQTFFFSQLRIPKLRFLKVLSVKVLQSFHSFLLDFPVTCDLLDEFFFFKYMYTQITHILHLVI